MENLVELILSMKEKEALALTARLLEKGVDAFEVLRAYHEAMSEIGLRFEREEIFLPELIFSGEMMRSGSEMIKPYLQKFETEDEKKGKVIMATVEGDIHDIGKDIVTMMLDINGFDVLDLGVDVPAGEVIKAAKDFQPQVIGLSGFLTSVYASMKATIEAIREEIPGDIKYMIGGGPMDNSIRDHVGADAYGKDAIEAVKLAKLWTGGGN
jgi:5-methyltetrahydrofolate--homocysteine methyltransferase